MNIEVIRQRPAGAAVEEDIVLRAETPPFHEDDTLLTKVTYAPGRSIWIDSEGNLWFEKRWTSAYHGAQRSLISVNSKIYNIFLEADNLQDGAPDASAEARAMTRVVEYARTLLTHIKPEG